MKKLIYASDFHGASFCWDKLLRAAVSLNADAIAVGGDLSGKAVVPIIDHGGERYSAEVAGTVQTVDDAKGLTKIERLIEDVGRYWEVMPEERALSLARDEPSRETLRQRKITERLEEWFFRAEQILQGRDIELFVIFGNDDARELDGVLASCQERGCRVKNPEIDVCRIGGEFELIGLSSANTTPFPGLPRDVDEEVLADMVNKQIARLSDKKHSVFMFHAPPYDSGIDNATEVRRGNDGSLYPVFVGGQPHIVPVGSKVIRMAIEVYQPILSLHGHIHESPGTAKIGRTVCVNAGSMHASGLLQAFWIAIDSDGVRSVRPLLV